MRFWYLPHPGAENTRIRNASAIPPVMHTKKTKAKPGGPPAKDSRNTNTDKNSHTDYLHNRGDTL